MEPWEEVLPTELRVKMQVSKGTRRKSLYDELDWNGECWIPAGGCCCQSASL
jgi:hypothetical protein